MEKIKDVLKEIGESFGLVYDEKQKRVYRVCEVKKSSDRYKLKMKKKRRRLNKIARLSRRKNRRR